MLDAVGNVRGEAHLCLDLDIGGTGSLLQPFKQLQPLLSGGITVLVIIDHVQRHQFTIQPLVTHQDGQVKQMRSYLRILHAEQNFLVISLRIVNMGMPLLLQNDLLGGMLCHQGTNNTSDEDHDHHAVEHIIVHQELSGSHLQAHSHHHHGDGTCRMSGCQTEHHIAIGLRKMEEKTGYIGSCGLSESTEESDEKHNPQHINTRKEGTHVDKHTHAYQEIGDKQGITDKLDTVHQGGDVWNISVEDQS